ncbi:MAG TPA: AmmeMemoRadiSam system protein B, partial [Thermodesulfobacteriota bacterium]|nr:AmmeMemoRadiSam system protein B [Thermodesulfobacteriota bacterium]
MTDKSTEYPKLRYIEAIPAEIEGERIICLRDPQNLSDKILAVSMETLRILSLFDGRRTVRDIQTLIMERTGELVPSDDINNLIAQLDEALFLDSRNFEEYKGRIESGFREAATREPSHAGLSYPGDPRELERWFRAFLGKAEESKPYEGAQGKLRGLISPHIDYVRGGVSYALAYRELLGESEADTFVIFGTSHYAEVENPFILTGKNFLTPLGEAETDRDIIEKLESACGWDLREGEISHRTEHSIEFQVAFLQHMLNGKRPFRIVPILCNSFHKLIRDGRSPAEDEMVSVFLEAVAGIVRDMGDRIFIIAGADMAHVGLKFGDSEPVSDSTLGRIRERDMLSLSFSEKIDGEGFYRSVEEEKD